MISGFFPPNSAEKPMRAPPGLRGQGRTGGRGAGEHHVVGLRNDLLPDDAARPGHDRKQLTRQASLVEQFGGGKGAVRVWLSA